MGGSADGSVEGVAVKWGEPTVEAVQRIALELRPEDVREVWASHRLTAQEAVIFSWAESRIVRAVETDDGVPVALTGVVGDRIWLLGTRELTATRRRRFQLCREGREWVEYLLKETGVVLRNDVYAKNTASVAWLKRIGFTVEPPRPLGESCELFHHFWRCP